MPKLRPRIAAYIDDLAKTLGADFDGVSLIGSRVGRKFSVRLVSNESTSYGLFESLLLGNVAPTQFAVSIEVSSFPFFSVSLEDISDRLEKFFGVISEHQTGDKIFDQRFLLNVQSNDWGIRLFGDSNVRESITKIFDLGYTQLICRDKEVFALFYPSNIEALPTPTSVAQSLDELEIIANLFLREPGSGICITPRRPPSVK